MITFSLVSQRGARKVLSQMMLMSLIMVLQTKKRKKLVPNNPEKLKIGERRSGRLKMARDLPREGGFGRGQPYQKPKAGIPSEAFAPNQSMQFLQPKTSQTLDMIPVDYHGLLKMWLSNTEQSLQPIYCVTLIMSNKQRFCT